VIGYTRQLSELRAADAERFGGKSASLGELLGAGAPVPGGFALAASAFEAMIAESRLGPRIAARLDALDQSDVATVASASEEIRRAIHDASLPPAIVREIASRYSALSAPPVAVRSSAIGEDSEAATFAGQQETYLWIRGEDALCDAVRACWASLYAAPALSYRARLGTAHPAMGVTVQQMVEPVVSGVMFTCSPLSGDPSIVAVNASWGLGEAVVGGEVTPDEYLLSKVTGELVRERIGEKSIEYGAAPGGGTVRLEVERERAGRRCLDDSQLASLLELALRVEQHFGCRQDIEWAIATDGEISLLQSRPVTVTAPKPPPPTGSAMALVMNTFGVRETR
jgi:pyruvate, water dikinase